MEEERKHGLTRRNLLRLGGMSAAGMVLAACPGPQETEDDAAADAPSAEPGSVSLWVDWTNLDPAIDTIKEMESFQEHIGNYDLVFKSGVQLEEKLAALAAGDPPDLNSCTGYVEFWSRGVILPVDDQLAGSALIDEDDLLTNLVQSTVFDGQKIGIVGIESYIWWGINYNRRHVEEAGLDPDNPPGTIEGWLEWQKEMTIFDDAGNMERVGWDPYDGMAQEPDYPAFAFGLNWWNDEEHTFHFDDERMAQAADTFGEFHRIAGPDNLAGMRGVDGQGYWGAAYRAEVQSAILLGYWAPGETTLLGRPETAESNMVTWVPVPASREGTKMMATGAHMIQSFKDSPNIEAGFRVSEFLTADSAALDAIFAEVGWLTGKKSYLATVDPDAFNGLGWYLDAPDQADEWLIGRRCPIHWFLNDEWAALREEVYRGITPAGEAMAELQKRAEEEYAAQGLG